ncbi:MAG: hypothetical protein LBT59_00025 [Clostridiales bacterium]|jgi:hypothetical protein|nr:hypothetical protein [Clostridiales bacterium]
MHVQYLRDRLLSLQDDFASICGRERNVFVMLCEIFLELMEDEDIRGEAGLFEVIEETKIRMEAHLTLMAGEESFLASSLECHDDMLARTTQMMADLLRENNARRH